MEVIQKLIKDSYPTHQVQEFYMEAAAWLYETLDNGQVKCNACKRHCVINPGKRGFCKARENVDGKLINKACGSLRCLYPDPFYFGNGTEIMNVDGFYCNYRCKFCMARTWLDDKKELPKPVGFCFPFNPLYAPINETTYNSRIIVKLETIIGLCKARDIKHIVIGRSEPTVNLEYIIPLAAYALNQDIKTILYTNGYSTKEVNRAFAEVMSEIIVGVKCYFDQAGYDKVCGPGINVEGIFETLLDLHGFGANYRIAMLADGVHGDPREAYRMMARFKGYLTEEEASNLNIRILPVIHYTSDVRKLKKGRMNDNVRPGDIIGAIELEMGLKRLGFHNARTNYSQDYKAIHGDYPSFWHDEAKNGWLAEIEKQEPRYDMKSYVFFGSPEMREPIRTAPMAKQEQSAT